MGMRENLDDLRKWRMVCRQRRNVWMARVCKKYGLASNMQITIDHDTGNILRGDRPEVVLCTLTKEELSGRHEIPEEADFDRWEGAAIRDGSVAAKPVLQARSITKAEADKVDPAPSS